MYNVIISSRRRGHDAIIIIIICCYELLLYTIGRKIKFKKRAHETRSSFCVLFAHFFIYLLFFVPFSIRRLSSLTSTFRPRSRAGKFIATCRRKRTLHNIPCSTVFPNLNVVCDHNSSTRSRAWSSRAVLHFRSGEHRFCRANKIGWIEITNPNTYRKNGWKINERFSTTVTFVAFEFITHAQRCR